MISLDNLSAISKQQDREQQKMTTSEFQLKAGLAQMLKVNMQYIT